MIFNVKDCETKLNLLELSSPSSNDALFQGFRTLPDDTCSTHLTKAAFKNLLSRGTDILHIESSTPPSAQFFWRDPSSTAATNVLSKSPTAEIILITRLREIEIWVSFVALNLSYRRVFKFGKELISSLLLAHCLLCSFEDGSLEIFKLDVVMGAKGENGSEEEKIMDFRLRVPETRVLEKSQISAGLEAMCEVSVFENICLSRMNGYLSCFQIYTPDEANVFEFRLFGKFRILDLLEADFCENYMNREAEVMKERRDSGFEIEEEETDQNKMGVIFKAFCFGGS